MEKHVAHLSHVASLQKLHTAQVLKVIRGTPLEDDEHMGHMKLVDERRTKDPCLHGMHPVISNGWQTPHFNPRRMD